MAPIHDPYIDRIRDICYRLEHYNFLTNEHKVKMEIELNELIAKRKILLAGQEDAD